ncbi:MAG TPA: hypothetical protein DGG94_03120 [Micromonosporaceae bacterium]|nr:hypothetical protein [Micromonosporaceae bacterium]HCU48806.1 hypothetical protein [Micromonosporaceae bacterium]
MTASRAQRLPTASALQPAGPGPDTAVFPRHLVAPGIPESEISVFADPSWQLSVLDAKATATSVAVIWATFPDVFVPTFKRASWALINIAAPAVIVTKLGTAARSQLRPSSINHTIRAWKAFAHWLTSRELGTLSAVGQHTLADYAAKLRSDGRQRDYCQRQLLALTRLWAYAPYLPRQDRLPRPPWNDHPDEYLGAHSTNTAGDNARIPIHPATMSPLLVWALRFVNDFAPDILAAREESIKLRANIRTQARPAGPDDIRLYLDELSRQGKPIPAVPATGVHVRSVNKRMGREPQPIVNVRHIAGLLGVTIFQVKRIIDQQQGQGPSIGETSPLTLTPQGRINGKPWLDTIDSDEAFELAMHLSTACLTVTAYLSGMRPEEVMHLQRGCCRKSESANGFTRYTVTGRHFKGVSDDDGNTVSGGAVRDQPWTVIAPVAAAIDILERLENKVLLFPREVGSILKNVRPRNAYRGNGLTPTLAAARIAKFIEYINGLAHRHGLPHDMIPADPDGPINLSRFRRTVAWFINRLPNGRVALGVQYGHLRLTVSESYGSRSRADLLEILDLEQARSIADTLAEAADRLHQGEGVSGPAAERYIDSVHEFKEAYAGSCLSKRQHQALLTNPKLKVYDHPEAFLSCNHNPLTALCDPERGKPGRGKTTPSTDRCQSACANISRTDTHISLIHKEITQLDAEIVSGLSPEPIARRLRQRRDSLQQTADRHEKTRVCTSTVSPEPA